MNEKITRESAKAFVNEERERKHSLCADTARDLSRADSIIFCLRNDHPSKPMLQETSHQLKIRWFQTFEPIFGMDFLEGVIVQVLHELNVE